MIASVNQTEMNVPGKSSTLLKRRLKIAELVDMKGEIKVEELSDLLGVSGVTIRGDLSYLEQQGYLKRSFGGAIATRSALNAFSQSEPGPIPPSLSLSHQLDIARQSAGVVSENQTVFLGHGEICRKIIPFLSHLKNVRLIVNDLQHALIAEQFIDGDIIVAGSELLRSHSILCGKVLDDAIEKTAIDHFIIDANIHDAQESVYITPAVLTPHYQRAFDKAKNITAIITTFSDAGEPVIHLGDLKKIKTLVISHSVNARYQSLLAHCGFHPGDSRDEYCTWINGHLL